MIRLAYISLATFSCFSFFKAPATKTIASPADFKQAVVVELFSSEGCSSCPPADALLNKIKAEADQANTPVFTLAFHVDYWDYIGWKDKLALPLSTERQYAYCKALNTNAYTPQAVINGTTQMVGSSEREVRTAIQNASKANTGYTITAIATGNKSKIDVDFTVSGNTVSKDCNLQVALVEDNIVSAVKKGENSGRTLTHNSVVRSFSTGKITGVTGKRTIEIPSGLIIANLRLVLFIQNSRDLHILNAYSAKISI